MTLDVGYSYSINLKEEEKIEINKQVRKNLFPLKILKIAIFFPFFNPRVPFAAEGFNPNQIIRNGRDRAKSAIDKKLAPLYQFKDECEEKYNEYKVRKNISPTLSKVSKKARKDKSTMKGLDKLEKQLENNELHAGRGEKKLPGTKQCFIYVLAVKLGYFLDIVLQRIKP